MNCLTTISNSSIYSLKFLRDKITIEGVAAFRGIIQGIILLSRPISEVGEAVRIIFRLEVPPIRAAGECSETSWIKERTTSTSITWNSGKPWLTLRKAFSSGCHNRTQISTLRSSNRPREIRVVR